MNEWKKKLPMWITWSRMALVPLILILMTPDLLYNNIWAALIFILASFTDYLDGYLARRFQALTNIGKFMDPIADKILVTSILVLLVSYDKIDPTMVILILARDTFIGGLRSVAAADQIIIAAKPTGKWKTALQMIAIPAVIIDQKWLGLPFDRIGYWVLWFSVILSLVSGAQYASEYFKQIREGKKSKPN